MGFNSIVRFFFFLFFLAPSVVWNTVLHLSLPQFAVLFDTFLKSMYNKSVSPSIRLYATALHRKNLSI